MTGSRDASLEPREGSRWARRPLLGWLVRATAFLAPVIAAFLTAWALTSAAPAPGSVSWAVIRWLMIAAASTIVLIVVERSARRLIPIATLLDLSLLFPDRAPSRFRIALRTGTTHQLQRRIAEARAGRPSETPADAAQRVLELVAALRMHDHITRGHSERVRAYTQMIADEMNLDPDERDRLRWAGLLHDVGKLLVPTSILNKKGKLSEEEFEIIKSHPENGRLMIKALVPWLGESARAVWEHHERWDGKGYPRGLAGDEISLAARIVSVADVYDVLTSSRSYKEPISPRAARIELARCAGSQFDPVVVRAFLNLSIGRVRRAAGPIAWIAQLPLFPTAVLGANSASGAVMLSGAIGMSSAAIGPAVVSDTFAAINHRRFDAEFASGWIVNDDTSGSRGALTIQRIVVDSNATAASPSGGTTSTTNTTAAPAPTATITVAVPTDAETDRSPQIAPGRPDPPDTLPSVTVTTILSPATDLGASTTSSVPVMTPSTGSVAPIPTTVVAPTVTTPAVPDTTVTPTVTTTVVTTLAPQVTTPQVTTPQVTAPQVTAPQVTAPQVTAPRQAESAQPPQAGGPDLALDGRGRDQSG